MKPSVDMSMESMNTLESEITTLVKKQQELALKRFDKLEINTSSSPTVHQTIEQIHNSPRTVEKKRQIDEILEKETNELMAEARRQADALMQEEKKIDEYESRVNEIEVNMN